MESPPSEQQTAPDQTLAQGQNGPAKIRSGGLSAAKIGAFAVVATIVALGAYFGTQAFLLNEDEPDDNRRAITAQRGTLLDEVSASGSVEFPELESMRFDISGSVGELMVKEGDVVTEGMPLIVLDGVTVAALESALAAAEIELETAGEELAELLVGIGELERAALESAAAKAEVDLQDASDALEELLSGATDLQRAAAASDLADARVATAGAAEALAEFTGVSGADSPATVDAKLALDDANEALADALAAAEDSAKSESEKVADAQELHDDALTDYDGQITAWFGSAVPVEDRSLSPSALVERWNATVDEIFAESAVLVDSPTDNPATPWNESVVWVWTHLTPYAILIGCDSTTALARCPRVEIDDAWDVQVTAGDALADAVKDAATAASAQLKLVDAARDVVKSAGDDIVDTTNDTDIGAFAAALDEAVEREKEFEATLAELDGLDQLQVVLATTAVRQARAQLDGALEDLAEAGLAPVTADGAAQDPDAMPVARAVLDPLQVNLATAAVNKAKAELDLAKEELAGVRLMAPFDGVITSISVSIGDPVSRNTAILDIVDLNVVTVDATVDEIDVLSLRIGDRVSVVLDALPGQTLEGTVQDIGDGLNVQGVIEFPLTIDLTPPEGIELIEGLSATATIVINQIDNALLIPLQSVGGSFTQPTVDVVTDAGFVTTAVALGASDDFWVIVESGLVEGQQVLMEVVESVDPLQQFFGGGRGFGGGFGGGGFGGGGQGGGGRQGGGN
ncbi:MAG: efflux RND transporter periplasmic adaptor subunit [Chloroflexi bacterium]|nr:efflux RND transporter periplasmic adaptor subunit [Chloroflexota bacterium]